MDSLDADGLPRLQEALARFDGPGAVFEHGLRALVAGFRAGSPD